MTKDQLKNIVEGAVKTNGLQLISGESLQETLKTIIDNVPSQDEVVSGIKGTATQANAPTVYTVEDYPDGLFERYVVSAPITSPNSWGNIVVTAEDLGIVNGIQGNEVILEVNNGVVTKKVYKKGEGLDAYETAVKNGFIGTYAEWVATLSVTNITNNYSVDPEQIVPSEATYQDDTLAGSIIKRIDKGTGVSVTYRESVKSFEKLRNISDDMVDNVLYVKKNGKYYINTDFEKNRTVYVDSYGIKGDDTFRTISTVFPNVTLAQVQALDSTATLSNSADWYILMWLNRYLPIRSTVVLTGKYIIDKKITWRRSYIKWIGDNFKLAEKYPRNTQVEIRQTNHAEDIICFMDGDGITNNNTNQIIRITLENIMLSGVPNTNAEVLGDGISVKMTNGDFGYSFFTNINVYHKNFGFKHYTGHFNEIHFKDCEFSQNRKIGFWTTGSPQAQINLLTFNHCTFGTNGLILDNGVLRAYNQTTDGISYDYGGISFGNCTAIDFFTNNTQSNNGFGLMLRSDAVCEGFNITGYSEGNPLGDIVVLASLQYSDIIINHNQMYNTTIYPELFTGVGNFITFKSSEHERKFVPSKGIAYNKELHRRVWSNNLIPDAKNNIASAITGAVTQTTSRDSLGYLVRQITKQKTDATISPIYFLTPEDTDKLKGLKKGDLIDFSFDFKFDSIDPLDYNAMTGIEFGILSYDNAPYPTFINKKAVGKPTTDGSWTRIRYTYEATGLESQTGFKYPFLRVGGSSILGSQIIFSIRRPAVRIKTDTGFFQEPFPNATTIYKGVVNQAAADPNSTATDVAGLVTDFNDLLAKLRTAGIIAP